MEEVFEKRSNFVMPTSCVELDSEEMSYIDGGLYLSNVVCNNIMFFTGIVTTIGSVIVKLSWAAIKPAIVAAYGISFFHAVYMAQQKGTGVDISFKWFRFKETYR